MNFLGVSLLVVLISSISILLLTPLAERIGLVDVPNHRKLHNGSIPLIGGISIYIGLVVGVIFFAEPGSDYTTYLVCSSLIVILGVMDDSWDISPLVRLGVQAVVALIMCSGTGLYINHIGDILGLGDIYLGSTGVLFTVVAVIAGINAFNMIDGVDGLLGISSLITFLGLGLLFFLNGDSNGQYMSFLIAVALVPYLTANLGFVPSRIRKIFMGDTGSMLIGFSVVWLLVRGSQGESPSFSAATALWLIAFPLMDMARVMLGRFKTGKPVFGADRTHLHHLLLLRNSAHRVVLLQICTLSAIFAVVGIVCAITKQRDAIIFIMFLASFVLYVARVNKLSKAL